MLNVYAGNAALNQIKDNGFSPDLFGNLLGASGGPKWFTLFGLDKYVETNEIVYVPPRRKISFKPSKKLSNKLKKEWNANILQ